MAKKQSKPNPLEPTARKLGELMVKTRLSPREIAQRYGRPETTIDEMLRGKKSIPLHWLDDLGKLARNVGH